MDFVEFLQQLKPYVTRWIAEGATAGVTRTEVGRILSQWLVSGTCLAGIDADTHNLNPPEWDSSAVIFLTSGAPTPFRVTGLAGGSNGRMAILYNLSSYTFVLPSESELSDEGNRFYMPGGNVNLAQAECAIFRYNSVFGVWMLLTVLGNPSAAGTNRQLVGEYVVEAGGCLIVDGEITVEAGSDLTLEAGADLRVLAEGDGQARPARTVTASGELTLNDDRVVFDSASALGMRLPGVVAAGTANCCLRLTNIGVGTVTLRGDAEINGSDYQELNQWESVDMVSNGSIWIAR